jgi:hypothetical protein
LPNKTEQFLYNINESLIIFQLPRKKRKKSESTNLLFPLERGTTIKRSYLNNQPESLIKLVLVFKQAMY